jgi:hypothetical protein
MFLFVSVSLSVSSLQQNYRNEVHSRNYCVSSSVKLSTMNFDEGFSQEIQKLVKSRISEDFSSLDESESSDLNSLISQLLALEKNYFPTSASHVQTQKEDQPSLLSKKPKLAVAPEHGDKSTTTTTARLSESDAEDERVCALCFDKC